MPKTCHASGTPKIELFPVEPQTTLSATNEFLEQVWKDVWLIQSRADLVSEATWVFLQGAINES
jgi:hypothetical protein